ncbi:hypothetical protein LTR36_006198 [Oleoguttula mirabilis]|uniref:SPRY domain-containing protein n=1 Tax=Oleoguttula mirabilis TaxID=1507867 RepID=A0AAV9JCZ4_9PEZI|nr:hypothetical protein LTR36_006198 [Oleoguttula mirabilis]
MGCLCFPTRRPNKDRLIFHWPNFTFNHSDHALNPRRIHSTFSLRERHKPTPIKHRRHSLPNGTTVANLRRPKKSKNSVKSTKIAPAATVNAMSDHYAPPPGPPPSYSNQQSTSQDQRGDGQHHVHWSASGNRELTSNDSFRSAHANPSQGQHPSNSSDAPPGYEPPSGPPLSWHDKKQPITDDGYAPPSRPPPSHQNDEPEPPPYDPWMAIPDNALLPPPPSIREERSPTANAEYDDAAHSIFLSDIPLYVSASILPRSIYYELLVLSMGHHHGDESEAGIAIGFLAPPYPSWRLPGWHRASLGVHGDDGRRYVDNSFGGQDFTQAFRKGDVVGIGMTFTAGPAYQRARKNRVDIFFTRNGKRDGGWDLHEEQDQEQEEGDVTGLEGQHDLLAAVGCFGGVEFEVRFRKEEWLFKP